MRSLTQYGKAIKQDDGSYKFIMKDKRLFQEMFADVIARKAPEVPVEIEVKKYSRSKTTQQIRYVKGPLMQHLLNAFRQAGHDIANKEEAEYIAKINFYYRLYTNKDTGEQHKVPLSLANISKEDMTAFIENVRNYAEENLNYYMPSAEDYYEEQYGKHIQGRKD